MANSRILKFRAWLIEDKSWISSFFIGESGDVWLFGVKDAPKDITDKVNVVQFTGLKDKNGEEIYEGDILKGYDGKTYKIVFPDLGGGFYMDWYDNIKKEGSRQIIGDYYNAVIHTGPSLSSTLESKKFNDEWDKKYTPEVIGNIYENPELLRMQ